MSTQRVLVVCLTMATFAVAEARAQEAIPEEAARLIAAHEEDAEAIRFEAERKIAVQRKQLVKQLKVVQDQYTRAAKLDEAVAIRDYIRAIAADALPAEEAPTNAVGIANQTGRTFYYRVTGNRNGSCYGTDVYTTDSYIATVAVHAGVLKHDETGVVKLRILPARANFTSTTRNGVTSSSWSNYPASYSVERVKFDESDAEADAAEDRVDAEDPFGPASSPDETAADEVPATEATTPESPEPRDE